MSSFAKIGRRTFLAGAAAAVSTGMAKSGRAAAPDDIPIIDAHIHLFDGTRPQGAPYVGSPAYAAQSRVSLPSGYRPLARLAGIVGAVVVETSPWIEDNLWLLETAQSDPMIVAVSGYLDPFKAEFGEYLDRFRKNPLYRAIRYSRFYTDDGGRIALAPAAIDNMKRLAAADLALDTANPSMGLLRANVLLADAVPDLRIIVDHLPSFDPTPENQAAYDAVVRDLAARPNVFVKLSQVYHRRRDRTIVTDFAPLRDRLDGLFTAFGEDRLMFGSDYPNSYGTATIAETVALMRRFYAAKPRAAAEKYFWRNAARVYKWTRRAPDQPIAAP